MPLDACRYVDTCGTRLLPLAGEHGRVGRVQTVDAHQHRDLAMTPSREAIGVLDRGRLDPVTGRPSAPAAASADSCASDAPTSRAKRAAVISASRRITSSSSQAPACAQRSRFQTHNSTYASPNAAFNCSSSSASSRSRWLDSTRPLSAQTLLTALQKPPLPRRDRLLRRLPPPSRLKPSTSHPR